jgi:hypothetical protein
MPRTLDPQQLALRAVQVFLIAVLVLAVLVALIVPYHATDALVYGQFSRMIGVHGGFFFDSVGYTAYARPLFYVPQGWLWWLFGAHEWMGRLIALGFFVALLWTVRGLARDRSLPAATPWLALLAMLAVPDVITQAFAGQTDVPVAAMLGVTGVLLLRRDANWATAAMIVVTATAAVLAKSTALPALVALTLMVLLGDRVGLWSRIRFGALPVVLGTVVGLAYDQVMARHFGMALNEFLGGVVGQPDPAKPDLASGAGQSVTGTIASVDGTSPLTAVAQATPSALDRVHDQIHAFFASDRLDALMRVEWFGPYLRMVVIFALVFAAARVVRVPHRGAAMLAFVAAPAWFFLAPVLFPAGTSSVDDSAGALVGSIVLLGPLAAVAWCPEEWQPTPLLLARMLLWVVIPLLAWAVFGIVADTRTIAPAWPALFVLVGGVIAMGVAGLATHWRTVAAGAIVLVLALAVLDLRNFDGLGAQPGGTINAFQALPHLTPATWTDPDAARTVADPQLGGLVQNARAARRPGDRLWTNDGRMIFFFLNNLQVSGPTPTRCDELQGSSVVAMLLNVGQPIDPSTLPCLKTVRVASGLYGVWRVSGS